jgi:hypothetical protein
LEFGHLKLMFPKIPHASSLIRVHDLSLPGQHTSQTQTSQTLVMERAAQTILLLILFTHFGAAQNAAKTGGGEFPVGVILDLGTLVGKIARTSIQMALEDFYAAHKNYNTKLVLHIRDSRSNNVQAASAGNSNCSAVVCHGTMEGIGLYVLLHPLLS